MNVRNKLPEQYQTEAFILVSDLVEAKKTLDSGESFGTESRLCLGQDEHTNNTLFSNRLSN